MSIHICSIWEHSPCLFVRKDAQFEHLILSRIEYATMLDLNTFRTLLTCSRDEFSCLLENSYVLEFNVLISIRFKYIFCCNINVKATHLRHHKFSSRFSKFFNYSFTDLQFYGAWFFDRLGIKFTSWLGIELWLYFCLLLLSSTAWVT